MKRGLRAPEIMGTGSAYSRRLDPLFWRSKARAVIDSSWDGTFRTGAAGNGCLLEWPPHAISPAVRQGQGPDFSLPGLSRQLQPLHFADVASCRCLRSRRRYLRLASTDG